MKEASLRKLHRTAGVMCAIFILFQIVTGIVLSIENILGAYWGGILHDIHEGWGIAGNLYRIILGIGLVWMVFSGMMIYRHIRRRMKKT